MTFTKESDLCAAFIGALPKGWIAYPETGGFDILLVRAADGFQIGVEAKLRLNAKVVIQAATADSQYEVAGPQPDCRAVLVPDGAGHDFSVVCHRLGVTVLRMRDPDRESKYYHHNKFHPDLPSLRDLSWEQTWQERCPAKRVVVPDYVPDVVAGASAPVALTHWKIGAIKLVITLERRGYLTRQDFAHFQISMSRWTQQRWIEKDGEGGWKRGPYLPDFKAQHPVNFGQIEADFEKWKSPSTAMHRGLFSGSGAAA